MPKPKPPYPAEYRVVLPLGAAAETDQWLTDPIGGCRIWTDQLDSFREAATWTGPCVDGKASGEGVLVWFKDDAILVDYPKPFPLGQFERREKFLCQFLKGDKEDETAVRLSLIFHGPDKCSIGVFRSDDVYKPRLLHVD